MKFSVVHNPYSDEANMENFEIKPEDVLNTSLYTVSFYKDYIIYHKHKENTVEDKVSLIIDKYNDIRGTCIITKENGIVSEEEFYNDFEFNGIIDDQINKEYTTIITKEGLKEIEQYLEVEVGLEN